MARITRHMILPAQVMITGYGHVQSAVDVMKLGASEYLAKPFENRQLVDVVNRLLSHQELGKDAGILRRRLLEKVAVFRMRLPGRMFKVHLAAENALRSGDLQSLSRFCCCFLPDLCCGSSPPGGTLLKTTMSWKAQIRPQWCGMTASCGSGIGWPRP